jgi:hypothetical protein
MYKDKEYYKEKRKESNRKWYISKGKEYYNKNKERRNKDSYKRYHSEKGKANRIKQYGITAEEYNKIFEKQKGYCAICGKHQSELKNTLSVDHDHITGKIRGLLCINCNTILGHSKDNPEILQKAVGYLCQ